MKIAIVEDEALAAQRLEELIREIEPDARISARLDSVADSVAWLSRNPVDLIFLDIQLADGISFAIFEQIKIDSPVIFTTAYDEYAIKAFKLNSVDYLLKPIRKEELRESLEKFRRLHKAQPPDMERLLEMVQGKESSYKKRFLIQYGERIKKIESDEIAYFYALEKCVFLTTFQNQTYSVDFSLDKLQEILDPAHFFRINRKMIIHEGAIQNMVAYSRSRIKIDLNPPEPKQVEALVSVERTPKFREWIDR